MATSDLILIGASFHPETKRLRQLKQPRRRNRWIGTIQLRSGLKIPITIDFVRAHYKPLVDAIEDGIALVEYKNDHFVDPEELRTLAFGSEEDQEAYEKRIADEIAEKDEELRARELERQAQADHIALQNRRAAAYRGTGQLPPGLEPPATNEDGEELTEEQLAERAANDLNDPQNNNLEGSHVVGHDDLLKQADDAARVEDSSAPSGHLQGLPPEPEGLVPDAENADGERAPAPAPAPEGPYQPLPEGWKHQNKDGLLALCGERGIDVSDGPSNKVLKQRLEEYEASRA